MPATRARQWTRRLEQCATYLKYILPLFPTLATVNCRPSRPAEPPSGVMSHFSLSTSFLPFASLPSSPPDLLSAAGSSDFAPATGERRTFALTVFSVSLPNGRGGDRLALGSRKPPALLDFWLLVEKSRFTGRRVWELVRLGSVGGCEARGLTSMAVL
jgi:hypothetical protein